MFIKKIISLFQDKPQPVPPPEPKKWAKIYMNADFINIMTLSGPPPVCLDPDGENIFLSVDAHDQVIGEAVFKALEKSRMIDPKDFGDFFNRDRVMERYNQWLDDCKKTYGYKTKKALYRNMKNVNVENYQSSIIFRPWNQEKPSIFGPTKNKEADNVVIPADSTPEEIGKAVRLALSRATSDV